MVALFFCGAVLARNYRESVPRRGPTAEGARAPSVAWRYVSLASRAALPLLLIPLFLGWYRFDGPHHDFWRGLDDWNNGDARGLAKMQQAVNDDSSMMPYQLALGVAQATRYATPDRRRCVARAARGHLEPRAEMIRGRLARIARVSVLGGTTMLRIRRSHRLADYHVTPVLVAGEVYEDLGRDEDAISTYGQVISMDAGLANSTFFQETEWRREHFDEILLASTIGINSCTYGAFLVEAERTGASTSDRSALEIARDDWPVLRVHVGPGAMTWDCGWRWRKSGNAR
jgi:hypothetical protein